MSVTAVAIVLLRDDGAALLQHRDDKPGLRHAGRWVIPGGQCEPDETCEQGARRELEEETAYQCRQLQWLKTMEDDFDPHHPAYQLMIFWGRYDGRQPVMCREGQALQFVARENAGRFTIPEFLLRAWDEALLASSQEAVR